MQAKYGTEWFNYAHRVPVFLSWRLFCGCRASNDEKREKEEDKKEDKKETKTRHFYAPKNFNKGGRVGLKGGSFPDLSGDGKTTFKDILIGRGVIKKGKKKTMMAKKSKSPMDKTVRKS